jgi:hypothetical protein
MADEKAGLSCNEIYDPIIGKKSQDKIENLFCNNSWIQKKFRDEKERKALLIVLAPNKSICGVMTNCPENMYSYDVKALNKLWNSYKIGEEMLIVTIFCPEKKEEVKLLPLNL